MTDQADKAQEFEQMHRDIARREQAVMPVMRFKGECYNCEAPILVGCFCDKDCRDDFELRLKQKRI